jgi:glycosyltransferase involved in cell wall biosynthesis
MKRVFIVTPAYNAGLTIERVFARMPAAMRERIDRFVVVDDGSTDDTLEALGRVQQGLPALVVLRHPENRGYGAAEKTLLRYAMDEGAEVAVLVHADGQYSPESLPEILEPFEKDEAAVVQGSRMLGGGALKGGMPAYKYFANRALTAVENMAFGLKMAEYHSGYMAYSRAFLEAVPFDRFSDSFDFDLEMIIAARILGMPIREVAIPTIYADEHSHLNPIKYGLDVLSIVGRYLRGSYHRILEAPRTGGGAR